MPTDPNAERARLAATYAGMPDLQLADVAATGDTLTDAARQALRAEIAKRSLGIEVLETSPEEPPPQNLVTIRQFRDLPTALLAKGALDSAGIAAFLADTNMVRMDWFISNAIGGVKLQVREENVAEANSILDQPAPDNFEVEGVGNCEQPKCPECQSLDVSQDPLHDAAGSSLAVSWLTGGVIPPVPLRAGGSRCNSCGHHWQDT
jgi:hypothetical protein